MSNTVENKATPKKPSIFASAWNGIHKILWGTPSPAFEKYNAEKAKTEGQKNSEEVKSHANVSVTRMLGYVNKVSMQMGRQYPAAQKNGRSVPRSL